MFRDERLDTTEHTLDFRRRSPPVCFRSCAGSNTHSMVSRTFQYPPGLLFTFGSRYYCAIGLRTCLDFPVHARVLRNYRSAIAVGVRSPTSYTYGTFTLFRVTFQESSVSRGTSMAATTSPFRDSGRSQAFSLAATGAIAFAFFSYGYYNALVPRVPSPESTGVAV